MIKEGIVHAQLSKDTNGFGKARTTFMFALKKLDLSVKNAKQLCKSIIIIMSKTIIMRW